jgi:hypothetical protein
MEYFQNLNISQLIGLILFVFGLVFFIISTFSVINSLRAKQWIMTIGKIIHSEVYVSKDAEDFVKTYRPNVVFEYSVFGEKFVCDRLYFGVKMMSSGNLTNSKKLVEKYSVNKEVAVYYNPDKPKQSVVEPGFHYVLVSRFVVSIGLITIGTLMFLQSDFVLGLFE